MKNKLFLLSMIVLFLSLGLFGQLGIGNGRIKGTIKDDSGKELAGAKITVTNLTYKNSYTVISDEKGKWSVAGLASGQYDIKATMEGYPDTQTEMVISFAGSRSQTLDVIMKKAKVVPNVDKGEHASPSNAYAILIKAGNELYNQNLFAEAVAKYEEALKTNASGYPANINIGNCYLQMKEYDKAVETYQKYLAGVKADKGTWAGNGDAARILSTIGRIHLDQQNIEKAKEYFKSAIDTSPNDEIILYNLGEILFNQGQAEQAVEYLKMAVKLKESWAPPYLKLGYAYLNRGEYNLALESMRKFLVLAPDDPQAPTVKKLIPQLEELAKKK